MKKFLTILKWTGTALVGLPVLLAAAVCGISAYKLNQTYNVPVANLTVPTDSASVHEEAIHAEGGNPFAPENMLRFQALDARYNHEVFYEQMPTYLARYSSKA